MRKKKKNEKAKEEEEEEEEEEEDIGGGVMIYRRFVSVLFNAAGRGDHFTVTESTRRSREIRRTASHHLFFFSFFSSTGDIERMNS